MVKFFSLQI